MFQSVEIPIQRLHSFEWGRQPNRKNKKTFFIWDINQVYYFEKNTIDLGLQYLQLFLTEDSLSQQ